MCVNAVFLGNLMVLAPLLLNGYAGTKYGIAFPVFLRSSFGRRGAVVAALSRGIVAIGAPPTFFSFCTTQHCACGVCVPCVRHVRAVR